MNNRRYYSILFLVVINFLFCDPKVHYFVISNDDLNLREWKFLDADGEIAIKCKAGYRLYHNRVRTFIQVELKNKSDKHLSLNVLKSSLTSFNYDYEIRTINSYHKSILQFYGVEKKIQYDSTNPILNAKPNETRWLYIVAEAETNFSEFFDLSKDEVMKLDLDKVIVGSKSKLIEQIVFIPEFTLK